jgi:hypothetical protein
MNASKQFEEEIVEFETIANSDIIIRELLENEFNNVPSSDLNEYLVDEPIDSFKNTKGFFNSSNQDDTFQYLYTNNEYYNEDYVKNPLLRRISLSKWPNVGFGFKLSRCDEKKYYYISEVLSDSPADCCLNLGDLIVELDEFENPFEIFNDSNRIENYLDSIESLHLACIANDNYLKFKLKNKALKNFGNINCEDIIIVTWNQLNKHDNDDESSK